MHRVGPLRFCDKNQGANGQNVTHSCHKMPHRTHRFRLHTAQLQPCLSCSFIFLSMASSSLTKSLRSASLRPNQTFLTCLRSSSLVFFSFVGAAGAVTVVPLIAGAVVDSFVVLAGCVMVGVLFVHTGLVVNDGRLALSTGCELGETALRLEARRPGRCWRHGRRGGGGCRFGISVDVGRRCAWVLCRLSRRLG